MQNLFPGLMASPGLFLHQVDWEKGNCLLIEADEDFYREAAFLDDRVLTAETSGGWFPRQRVAEMVAATAGDAPQCHFIFHIGHCGSTLISRALGQREDVLSLREPQVLRGLAEMELALADPGNQMNEEDFAGSLALVYRLLGRRFAGQNHVLVKATSFCSSLGPHLMEMNPGNRALLLGMAPEIYISAMLGAPEYVADVQKTADHRLKAFNTILSGSNIALAGLSDPALVALSWATEILNLANIADSAGGGVAGAARTQYLDFDYFLADRDQGCLNIAAHFGFAVDDGFLQRLKASGIFGQYSKATDYAFGAEARLERLNESRAANAAAISEGLEYLGRLAGEIAPLQAAMQQFGYGD